MQENQFMLDTLEKIRCIEPRRKVRALDVPNSQIGSELIEYYYSTSNLKTRQLIRQIMEQAGFEWTRKLITRNSPPEQVTIHFAGLAEYTQLAAVNDPGRQWNLTG